MSLESAIADLVSASTQLTKSVNVTRATVEATRDSAIAKEAPVTTAKDAVLASTTAATTDATTTGAKLAAAAADYATQKTSKGLAAVQTSADSELKDRLHRRDPARHPFRGARPSLVMDFVRRECHRNNAAGNLEPVDLNTFMTFTRGSTATYVGPDGLIKTAGVNEARYGYDPVTGEALGLLVEEQRTNLFPFSTQLHNPSAFHASMSCTTTPADDVFSPDGSLTATVFRRTSASAAYTLISLPTASGATVSQSIYLRRLDCDYASLRLQGNTTYDDQVNMVVNLATGTIAQAAEASGVYTSVSGSLTYVGNGWYRATLSAVVNADLSTRCLVSFSDQNSKIDGTSTSATVGGYIWGAQLEDGSFPTSYIPTPATFTGRASTKTYFDSNGVMQTAANDVAVTDHGYVDGRWVSKGLSLEGQATNLLTKSAQVLWTNGRTGNTVGLSLVTNADPCTSAAIPKMVNALVTGTPYHPYISGWGAVVTAGGVYTLTMRLRLTAGEADLTSVSMYNGTNISSTGFPVKAADGFKTVTLTFSGVATGSTYPVVNCSKYDLVYMQLETGPVATSYIPTTTAQVTRAADTSTSAQVTRASDVTTVSYAASPIGVGTVNVVHDRISNLIGYILEVNTGGVDNSRLVCRSNGSTSFRVFNIRTLLTTPSQDTDVTNIAARSAFALSYSGVGCKTSRGGGVVKSLPSIESAHASVFNTIRIGWTSDNISNGYIRQLTYFPRQLSDADLQALTILED